MLVVLYLIPSSAAAVLIPPSASTPAKTTSRIYLLVRLPSYIIMDDKVGHFPVQPAAGGRRPSIYSL
jgi:hypothetical protein